MIRFLLALLAVAIAAPAVAQGRFVEQVVDSSQLNQKVHVTVWLPPGYDSESERRYPVLYMNDGQNLFFKSRSGYQKVWAADQAALSLVGSGKVAPFIIVGVDHPGEARYRQYFPAKVLTGPVRQTLEKASGPLLGDYYVRFLADELKPIIDSTYRTRPKPRFTAVAGSSMGGLISLYALAERPDVFGRAAAVSTHSPLVAPGEIAAVPRLAETIKASWRIYLYERLGRPKGRKLWMDHGTATLDQHYAPFQAVIDAELRRIGWRQGRDFESRVYEGAEHEENAWAARLPEVLAWLLDDWR